MAGAISYRPDVIDELISSSRIHSYLGIFAHSNDAELVGAYLWNSHVCAQLYPLVQLVEVSLRNAIDASLTPARNQMWWAGGRLRHVSYRPGSSEPEVVMKLRDNFAKAARQVASEKRARYRSRVPATHAEIVAKTEFSTWEWILDSEFYGPGLFWPDHLGQAFRGDWGGRGDLDLLTHARDQVRSIRMFRNRLFHHEPAWKKFGVATEADAINHLQERVVHLSDFLDLLHTDLKVLATKSFLTSAARRACTLGELHRFQHKAREHKLRTKREVKTLVRACALSDENAIANTMRSGQKFLIVPMID